MANAGRTGTIRYEDNWAAVTVGTGLIGLDGGTNSTDTSYGLVWVQSIDTGNTSFVRTFSAARGMHLAGSLDATDNDMMEFNGDKLMFYGQQGFTAVEILFQVDASSVTAFNFGFSDDVTETSATLPVECSATSFASSASTFLGFVYDDDATNKDLHCFWTDDDVDTTKPIADLRMQGFGLTASKWLWLRVEMQDQGSGNPVRATFHAVSDGKHATKEFTTTVDRDQGLCYYFGIENRGALARGVFIKQAAWEQSIAD